jgi:Flp pilus assembly protein TadB
MVADIASDIEEAPMISQRSFTIFSFLVIAVMAAMLVLVYFRLVPQSWYWYMFAIVLVLFLIRTTLRLILGRQQRLEQQQKENPPTPPTSPS